MESKTTVNHKVAAFALKHKVTILDYTFVIVVLWIGYLLLAPTFGHYNNDFNRALNIVNITLLLTRVFVEKKYRRLAGYLHGIIILIVIVVCQQYYY